MAAATPLARRLLWSALATALTLLLLAQIQPDAAALARFAGEGAAPEWTSLAPPALAVVWAFTLGSATAGLLLAIVAGSVMLAGMDPFAGLQVAAVEQLGATLTDADTLKILVFTATLVGLIQVCVASGGIPAVVARLSRRTSGRLSTQRTTALLGTMIFFDDYANTMVVGSAMRPLADRTRTSREKLAFLVDATSAPIAGVAFVSTWIGMEIKLFEDQLADFGGLAVNGYAAFFAVLPYRFYCIAALCLVAILVWTGRDFGPMLRAERRAAAAPPPPDDPPPVLAARAASPIDGVGPIAVVMLGILGAFAVLGAGAGPQDGGPLQRFVQAFIGASDHTLDILAWAGVIGSVVSLAWARLRTGLSLSAAFRAYAGGLRIVAPTLIILVCAMTIRSLTDALGTGDYLAALLEGTAPGLLPAAVFLLAAIVAFSTGSSWATMGLLIPVAMPLAAAGSVAGGPVIILATAAAVLDGAIFGDHCSPISDTTVMSSAASGCDHLAHVRTQMPYAVLAMMAAVACGYGLVVQLGGGAWIGWTTAAVLMAAVVVAIGRRPEAGAPTR